MVWQFSDSAWALGLCVDRFSYSREVEKKRGRRREEGTKKRREVENGD